MRSRLAAAALLGAAFVLTALTLIDIPVYQCPVQRITGQPCPGCGMTRGVAALLSGRVIEALSLHAFSPLAVIALAGLAIAAVLPTASRDRLARAVASLERRTLITVVLSVALFVYWIGRLVMQAGPDHIHLP